MTYGPDDIKARLQRLKDAQVQRDTYLKAPTDYRTSMPAELATDPQLTQPLLSSAVDNISQQGTNATALSQIKMQNRDAANYLAQQQAANNRAQEELKQAQRPFHIKQTGVTRTHDQITGPVANRGFRQPHSRPQQNTSGRNWPKRWGPDNTPEVSDLHRIKPHAQLVQAHWRGQTFTVNKQVAPIFISFLDDLAKTGYKPVSLSSYNPASVIPGTSRPSLHAYGLALDINPQQNPYQDAVGKMQSNLPPRVRALAAKYGLSWGGNWIHNKDPMHFSVSWDGME